MFSCIPNTTITIIIMASRAWGEARAKLPEMPALPAHLQACIIMDPLFVKLTSQTEDSSQDFVI